MFCENVTMKEQNRLIVLNWVEQGMMAASEAAQILVSPCTRLKNTSSVQEGGSCCIGAWQSWEEPHNALDDRMKRRVLELARVTYADCNIQHFTLASRGC